MSNTKTYTYVGNVDPANGTTEVVVEGTVENPEKVLYLDGPAVELTEDQYDALSASFVLEEAPPASGDGDKPRPRSKSERPARPEDESNINSAPLPTGGSAGSGTGATGVSSGGNGPATR